MIWNFIFNRVILLNSRTNYKYFSLKIKETEKNQLTAYKRVKSYEIFKSKYFNFWTYSYKYVYSVRMHLQVSSGAALTNFWKICMMFVRYLKVNQSIFDKNFLCPKILTKCIQIWLQIVMFLGSTLISFLKVFYKDSRWTQMGHIRIQSLESLVRRIHLRNILKLRILLGHHRLRKVTVLACWKLSSLTQNWVFFLRFAAVRS